MLRIALCEDEQYQLNWLQTALTAWVEARKILLQVDVFQTAEELLRHYQIAGQYDLLLLDIHMETGIDGMAAARFIRDLDAEVYIIFITGNKDYLVEGYEVEAFRYLLKPIQQNRLFQALDATVAKLEERQGEVILLATEEGHVKISLPDIFYIESRGHFLEVRGERGIIQTRGTLSSMEQTLDTKGFARSHRSYLVNLCRIFRLKENHCLLDNGQRIPVSRKQYPVVKKAFMDWVVDER
ncbi:MAG: response regulator transcription factor [Tissierellia bacterium]|nr:response regulator transcription factor [Tissierellia bacterium]